MEDRTILTYEEMVKLCKAIVILDEVAEHQDEQFNAATQQAYVNLKKANRFIIQTIQISKAFEDEIES